MPPELMFDMIASIAGGLFEKSWLATLTGICRQWRSWYLRLSVMFVLISKDVYLLTLLIVIVEKYYIVKHLRNIINKVF